MGTRIKGYSHNPVELIWILLLCYFSLFYIHYTVFCSVIIKGYFSLFYIHYTDVKDWILSGLLSTAIENILETAFLFYNRSLKTIYDNISPLVHNRITIKMFFTISSYYEPLVISGSASSGQCLRSQGPHTL